MSNINYWVRLLFSIGLLVVILTPSLNVLGEQSQEPLAIRNEGSFTLTNEPNYTFDQGMEEGLTVEVTGELPYGVTGGGLLIKDSPISGIFIVNSYHDGTLQIELEIDLPHGIIPLNSPNGMNSKEVNGEYSLRSVPFQLSSMYDGEHYLVDFFISQDAVVGEHTVEIKANISGIIEGIWQSWEIHRDIRVRIVTKKQLKDIIRVPEVIIPTNYAGVKEKDEQEANTIVIHQELGLLEYLEDSGYSDRRGGEVEQRQWGATIYITVVLENRADSDVILKIELSILDPVNKTLVRGFQNPLASGKGNRTASSIVLVPAGGSIREVLPLWAKEGEVLPGEYIARVTVRVYGSDAVVVVKDIPIEVIGVDWSRITLIFITILITLIVGIVFWIKRAKIFGAITSKEFILIALFGSTIFVIVNIPSTLIWPIAMALLGPFRFFITGIVAEVIFYTLLMAMVVLIPKPGVIILSTTIRFLMHGFMLGHFSLVDMLSYAILAVVLEITLYVLGFTRRRGRKDLFETKRGFVTASIGCGIADAYHGLVYVCMLMILYRLFYADWYINFVLVLVNGFIYTAIGTCLGILLGRKLKKVVME